MLFLLKFLPNFNKEMLLGILEQMGGFQIKLRLGVSLRLQQKLLSLIPEILM